MGEFNSSGKSVQARAATMILELAVKLRNEAIVAGAKMRGLVVGPSQLMACAGGSVAFPVYPLSGSARNESEAVQLEATCILANAIGLFGKGLFEGGRW